MTAIREEIEFTSGGVTCAGTLFLPGEGEAPWPAVVLAHGFTATRTDGLPGFAELLTDAGFAAFTFDYRGFGDSAGNERQVLSIPREIEDVAAALEFARSEPRLDADRLALWGSSLGGGLTLETLARDRGIRCGIIQVPFTDGFAMLGKVPFLHALRLSLKGVRDLVARTLKRPRVMIPAAGDPGSMSAMASEDALPGFEKMKGPDSRHQNLVNAGVVLNILAWRPNRRSSQIECPLLVQVAEKDRDVPVPPARKLAERMDGAELKLYDCGHFDVYNSPWLEQLSADQVEFLNRHL